MTEVEKIAAMAGLGQTDAVPVAHGFLDAMLGDGRTVWDGRRAESAGAEGELLSHSDHLDHNDGHVDAHGDHGDK